MTIFSTVAEPDFVPTEPPFTPDDQLLVDELRRRGHRVAAVVWGEDPSRLPERFDRLVIRSPWDCMDRSGRRRDFLRWLELLADCAAARAFKPTFMDRCRHGDHPVQPFLPEICTAGSLLSECEGVRPKLFFRARPGSEARFADCLCAATAEAPAPVSRGVHAESQAQAGRHGTHHREL